MNKAHGIDYLINEHFMRSIDILVEHISIIFNAILDFFQIIGLKEYFYLFLRKTILMMSTATEVLH